MGSSTHELLFLPLIYSVGMLHWGSPERVLR